MVSAFQMPALLAMCGIIALSTGILSLVLLCVCLRFRVQRKLHHHQTRTGQKVVAFLHPFCDDGGGGERVLWVAIRELLRSSEYVHVIVYTGDSASDQEICAHALSRFGVHVAPEVEFVRLKLRGWIEPKRYPVATLIGQAIGSLLLGAEAVARAPPHVLVDTTGLHFCLPLLRLLGVAKLACYVHYPIISSDMIGVVAARRAAHNNANIFARSAFGARVKVAYYQLLVALYRAAGRRSDVTMVNGSWTAHHIRALWDVEPKLVFPPCDTSGLQALPLEPFADGGTADDRSRGARRLVLSVAQFRPEKDHAKQVRAFARLLDKWRAIDPKDRGPRPTLLIAGAVRHAEDARRLDELRSLTATLVGSSTSPPSTDTSPAGDGGSFEDAVRFAPNMSLDALRAQFGVAAVGLHTMWNEHFGIGVVEMCAAGIAVIAHNSGGPALDIIHSGVTGYLADSEDEYAEAMATLLLGPKAEERRAKVAAAGRARVATRFSEAAFASAWSKAFAPALS